MGKKHLWTHWLLGLIVIVLLACGAAWLSGWLKGGRAIHFWMDDATGLEPGTVVNLSGVRAGAVTRMSLDADPGQDGEPRAKVQVNLTTESFDLINPKEWVVAITTSPLPGFKAEVDLVRHKSEDGRPLPELPDGAWHTDTRSAVTKQINLAFDALMQKLHGLSGGDGSGAFSFRDLFKHPGGEGEGDGTLMSMVFTPEQIVLLTDVLKNMDTLTAAAADGVKDGGLARAALGAPAHANLLRLTEDLTKTASIIRTDLEANNGALLHLLLKNEDTDRVTEVLKNIDSLTSAAAESQRQGGLALAALGGAGHANLMRLTEDLTHTVGRLRADLEGSGSLLKTLLPDEDLRKINVVLGNLEAISNTAKNEQIEGGLVRTALGDSGHANLMRMVNDMTKTVSRLRTDLEQDGAVLRLLLAKDDTARVSEVLRKIDAIADTAAGDIRQGGLARTALGDQAQANLLRMTDDLAGMTSRIRSDLGQDGPLIQLLLSKEDVRKFSDLLGNVDIISRKVGAIDLAPLQEGMQAMGKVREALDNMSGMVTRLTAPGPGGAPGALEAGIAELPQHLQTVYGSIEKASRTTEEIMDQTSEVLRKANMTVSAINQLLTGLKRSWLFRGAFNESLRYEDLAPYLVPSPQGSGERMDYDDILKSLEGVE